MKRTFAALIVLFCLQPAKAQNFYQASEITHSILKTTQEWESNRWRLLNKKSHAAGDLYWILKSHITSQNEVQDIAKNILPVMEAELQPTGTLHTGIPRAVAGLSVDQDSLNKLYHRATGLFSDSRSGIYRKPLVNNQDHRVSFYQYRDEYGVRLSETTPSKQRLLSFITWDRSKPSDPALLRQEIGFLRLAQNAGLGHKATLSWTPPVGRTDLSGVIRHMIKNQMKGGGDTIYGLRFYLNSSGFNIPFYPNGQLNRVARLTCALLRL